MASALLSKSFVGAPSALLAARPSQSRCKVVPAAAAADRTLWLPNLEPPKYLDGSLPGDFGFDPLSLGVDKERLAWFAEAEKTNGRWAMAGTAGIVGQELLGVDGKWFEAGAKDYWIDPLPLTGIEFIVFGFLELKRYQGWKKTGGSGVGLSADSSLELFPFDPVGLNSDSNAVKELKNGRLAMLSFVGYVVQALVTREGPIEGMNKHIADPLGHNIWANLTNNAAFF